MKPAFKVIGLGEVLWDMLPGGKQLGGAPANFAYMASLLGDDGIVASRVGTDPLGQETLRKMARSGLAGQYVQLDAQHSTGIARITVDAHGQPAFTILQPVAWDFLEWTPAWEDLAALADVICFGTLAQRSPASRATIQRFLQTAPSSALRIFDVNLRQNFFSAELVEQSLKLAQVVKLNHDELPIVMKLLGMSSDGEEISTRSLLERFGLQLVCVTRGARGSLLLSPSDSSSHNGFQVKVADTVGAGDAFTACLAHHYLRGASLEQINDAANRFAAWVASRPGATPSRDETTPKTEPRIHADVRG
jgi:fructokinase